ncbi:MAG: hypothetical protein V1804_02730 [Patescibacteria group bacterium]
MKLSKFDNSKNISGGLALLIIMILSVFVAWFSLETARKIIDSAPDLPALNTSKRID